MSQRNSEQPTIQCNEMRGGYLDEMGTTWAKLDAALHSLLQRVRL
jgi:hypothetical protein